MPAERLTARLPSTTPPFRPLALPCSPSWPHPRHPSTCSWLTVNVATENELPARLPIWRFSVRLFRMSSIPSEAKASVCSRHGVASPVRSSGAEF